MTKTCLSFFYIYKMRSEQKIDVSWSVSACISFIFLFTLWHYDLSGILRTIWHASRLVLYSLTWFETKIPCKMVVIMQSIYSFRKLCITFKKGVTVLFVVSPYFTRRDIYFLLNTHLKVKTQFSVWTPFFSPLHFCEATQQWAFVISGKCVHYLVRVIQAIHTYVCRLGSVLFSAVTNGVFFPFPVFCCRDQLFSTRKFSQPQFPS